MKAKRIVSTVALSVIWLALAAAINAQALAVFSSCMSNGNYWPRCILRVEKMP